MRIALLMTVLTSTATYAQTPARWQIVPRVEHHTHIVGPGSVTAAPPGLDSILLPAPLERVLRAREEAIKTPAGIAALYTANATILDITSGSDYWRRGLEGIRYVLGAYTPDTRYVPNTYELGDSAATIAGVVRSGASREDDMFFMLGLRKDAGGHWRIATEYATVRKPAPFANPITADKTIAVLDDAGIERAVLLSVAYWHGSFSRTGPLDAEYDNVRAENDWVVGQAARYPARLVAFCSVNPLKPYAIAELERCAAVPGSRGMKLHFGNSGVDLKKAEHVTAVRSFFAAANEQRMAIVVHLWTLDRSYGAEHSRLFLEEILPHSPDVTVQIAHMAGGGRYAHDDAMKVFADAITAGDVRMKNVLFDLTTVVEESTSPQNIRLLTERIRQVGPQRILFGADTPLADRPSAGQSWATFRRVMPLTDDELRTIADNVAPYMRSPSR